MAAAVAAALGGAKFAKAENTQLLTWDSDATTTDNVTDGGGIWVSGDSTSPTATTNWFNSSLSTDVVFPLSNTGAVNVSTANGFTNASGTAAPIAVFGAGGVLSTTSGLQVVTSFSTIKVLSGVSTSDDKGIGGLTFNQVGMQNIANLTGTWTGGSTVISVSGNLTNVHQGEVLTGSGIAANTVIMNVNTVSNTVTVSQATTGPGSSASLVTSAGYILAGNRWFAPTVPVATITLGANTDTIIDNTFTNYTNYQTTSSLDGGYIADLNFGSAHHLGTLTNIGNVLFEGSGTLTFPGIQGLNGTMASDFTGTAIFAGGSGLTQTAPSLNILGGTTILDKYGSGSALGAASLVTLNGPSAKLAMAGTVTQWTGTGTLVLSQGEFDLDSTSNQNLGYLTDGGVSTGIVNAPIAGTNATLTLSGTQNIATTFSGIIENTGGVLSIGKSLAGTLVLSNTNTYSGTTLATNSGNTFNVGAAIDFSSSGSAANSNALIEGGSIIFDNTGNSTGGTIARLANIAMSSNASNGADGLIVVGGTNTTDTVGAISINTVTGTLFSASGVAVITVSGGSNAVLNAASISNNGVGVLALSDSYGSGTAGATLGTSDFFKVNDGSALAAVVNGVIPWAIASNSGFLTYNSSNGFVRTSGEVSGSFVNGQAGPGTNFNGGVGIQSVTSTAYNSLFDSGGVGSITIGGNFTLTSGALAAANGALLTTSGGTITLPNTGYFFANNGASVTLGSDLNTSHNIRLATTFGAPGNFVLAAANPDFTGTLTFGGVGSTNNGGGPTLTLTNVNALVNATLDTSLSQATPPNGGTGTGLGPQKFFLAINGTNSLFYNIGGIDGTGQLTISGGNSQNYFYTNLAVGGNSQNDMFSGAIIQHGGNNGDAGGISTGFTEKVGSGTWTLAGLSDDGGFALEVLQGTAVLAKNSSASAHSAAIVWVNGGKVIMGGTGNEQIYDAGGTLLLTAGLVDLNGNSQFESNFLGGGGTLTNNGTVSAYFIMRPTGQGNVSNFSGSFMDGASPLGLVIGTTGSSFLTLSGNSAFSGASTLSNNSTINILAGANVSTGAFDINNTNGTPGTIVTINGNMTTGNLTFHNNVVNLNIAGTGNLSVNGSLIGAVTTTNAEVAVQSINLSGNLGINGANSPFAGSITVGAGNLSMLGGSASAASLVTLNGISSGLNLTNATGGSLTRLTTAVFNGSSTFINATGGSTATSDLIAGTLTVSASQLGINLNAGAVSETLDINDLNLINASSIALKINTNGVLGGSTKLIVGNASTFLVGGVIPFAVESSSGAFGLVTTDTNGSLIPVTSFIGSIVDGNNTTPQTTSVYQGNLGGTPFNTGASNSLATSIGALSNTGNFAVFSLGNTLTLVSGAMDTAPNLTINDVSGSGIGVLAFAAGRGGKIYAQGGGTVTINAPMAGTAGVAMVTATPGQGTDFVLNAVNPLGGSSSLGSSDTLTLGNTNPLPNSALVTGTAGTVLFGSGTSYTLGGLGGGASVKLDNSGSTAVNLFLGTAGINTTYAANFSGDGSITKIGASSMAFDVGQGGNNGTYLGDTNINGGTLGVTDVIVNNTIVGSFGPGAITVNNGGTFGVLSNATSSNVLYLPNVLNLNNGAAILDTAYSVHVGNNSPNATAATMSAINVAAGANVNLITTASGNDILLDGILSLPVNSSLTIVANATSSQGGVHFSDTANNSGILGTIIINGTTNNGGRILDDVANALANATLMVAGGTNNSTFFVAGSSVGALTGTGVVQLTTSGNGAVTVSDGLLGNSTFAGHLTGSGALLNVTSNTITLSGVGTLTGGVDAFNGYVDIFGGGGLGSSGSLNITSPALPSSTAVQSIPVRSPAPAV